MNVVVFNVMLALVCGYALWRGGAPERIAAVAFAAAAAVTYAFMYNYGFGSLSALYFALDVALFAAIAGVSIIADRFWPMWAAAIQLVIVAVHAAKALRPELLPFVYYVATAKLAYPMVVLLGVGTLRHRARLARWGSDAGWSVGHDRSTDPTAHG